MKKNLISIAIGLLFCIGLLLVTSENEYNTILPNLVGVAIMYASGKLFEHYKDDLKDTFLFSDDDEYNNN